MSGVRYGGLRTAAMPRLRDLIARRRTRKLVAALPPTAIPAGCTARSLSGQNGVSVLVVETQPELILRAASDAQGRATILRHRRALAELHEDPRCDRLAPVLPRVVEGAPDGSWLVESAARGEPEEALSDRGGAAAPEAALDALSLLHDSTDEARTVGEPDLHAWVGAPVGLVRKVVGGGRATRGLDAIESYLRLALANRPVTIVRIHGDATPGNFLFTPGGERVAGIIDWEASRRGLPEVDIAHYLISERCWKSHAQLGDVVVDVLRHGWSPGERELLDAHSRNREVAHETIVLLVWLLHVSNNLRKAGRYAHHLLWIRSNINRVLVAVDGEALLPGRVPSGAFTQSDGGADRDALVVDLAMHAAEVWRLLVRETEAERWLDAFLLSAAADQILEDALARPQSISGRAAVSLAPSTMPLGRAAARGGRRSNAGLRPWAHAEPGRSAARVAPS